MTDKERQVMSIICASIGKSLTEEQREFASDFRQSTISFSNPGTGKTMATVVGLIMAQTCHGVPGDMINAMSFTKMATASLKNRYDKACERCSIRPTVQFKTLHAMCLKIIHEVYPRMRIADYIDWETVTTSLAKLMSEYGLVVDDMSYVRKVYEAMSSLNSALVFDDVHVELMYKFKKLNMDLRVFQELRVDWFLHGITFGEITLQDIPIYALYCLLTEKEVGERYKGMFKIMVVDELQDLTLLQLRILSMLTETLIGIGDMKQQIYAFNGSALRIVQEYKRLYPNAREVNLTQSFRCKDEIAEFATRVIVPNDPGIEAFRGVGSGGVVKTYAARDLDLSGIVADLARQQEEQQKNGVIMRDTMFLFRNNMSVTPIVEELYRQGVKFRVNKFLKVMDMPIFKDMCLFVDVAKEPANLEKVKRILRYIPEFSGYDADKCPLIKVMIKTGKSLFDVPYRFNEQETVDIIQRLRRTRAVLDADADAGKVFNSVYPLYEKYVIKGKWYTLDLEKEFYFNMVRPIVENVTYDKMVLREWAKERINKECINAGMGVRCYTVHSAKGLEADDVYLLDTEDVLYPSQKNMDLLLKEGCNYEAASALCNERNLIYVAATRAKERVIITYQSRLTELITKPMCNKYSELDELIRGDDVQFDEIGAFTKMFRIVTGEKSLVEVVA